MRRNWTQRLFAWLQGQRNHVSGRRSARRGRHHTERFGAIVSHLETLESRKLLTNLIAVNVSSTAISLNDITPPRVKAYDTFDISYTSTQVVLTAHTGTMFQVNGKDLSTYTATITSPVDLSMNLIRFGNTVTVTGDGTASLKALDINLGGGTNNNGLTLTKVNANSVNIHNGGFATNLATISQSTINNDLNVNLGFQSGDHLDLENTTVKGNVNSTVGQFTANHSTITGSLTDWELRRNSSVASTASTYTGPVTIFLGGDSVIGMYGSPDGPSHFHSKLTVNGPHNRKPTIYEATNSIITDVTPSFRNVNVTNLKANFTAPTVTSLAAATTTPTVKGTFDSANSPTLTVAVNGKTYKLGTDAQLTSPSTGNWSLDLTGAPLTSQSTTVTATAFDKYGDSLTGTGTVTNEQSIISSYVTKNNLTSSVKTTASGLNYVVTTQGAGPIPTKGQTVSANYTGWIMNADGTKGTQFDTNTSSTGFPFIVGAGQVIAGWDEAFQLLPVGTFATLLIPSSLAYGPTGNGSIPANSILIFDVKVLAALNTPTVNSLTSAGTTPTITGTYDSVNQPNLTVTVANLTNTSSTTYTLNGPATTDKQLTSPSAGTWSLNLTSTPLTAATTYNVSAKGTDKNSYTATGKGTVAT
jgi:FKBP-type peptidyl-prolyl cis-trans isomerase